jgi:transposase
MSYEKKTREQAVKYREKHTQAETRETFGVSVRAIKDWQKLLKRKGNVEKEPLKRSGRKIKEEA